MSDISTSYYITYICKILQQKQKTFRMEGFVSMSSDRASGF
ncbi:hypothetical protein CHCC14820_1033 [Bacillus paralicheniformis]|nr:hypothetical protein CHCC14820_1033 [Bacillus paralicheniformis]